MGLNVSILKKALSINKSQPLPSMLSEEMESQVTPAAVKAVCNTAHETAEVLLQ